MNSGYYTLGKHIMYNGNKVILKGVSKTGLEYLVPALQTLIPETIEFDVKKIVEWGCNVVRIPMRDVFWLHDDSYRQKLSQIVDKFLQNKVVVILDLHTQQYNPNMDDFMIRIPTGIDGKQMWIQLAEQYKNTSAVFFEIFNEPHNISPNTWWRGNDKYYGYKEILDVIRQRADNICIIGGLDYAYQWSFLKNNTDILQELKTYKNIAMATHPYGYRGGPKNDGTDTHQIPTRNIYNDGSYTGDCSLGITVPTIPQEEFGWNESFGYLMNENLFPVIATEWGLDRKDNCIQGGWYNNEILHYINSMNMSYTAWAWVQDRLDYPSLLGDGFEPTGKATRDRYGPACSGKENNYYPGPGKLVYNDIRQFSNKYRKLSYFSTNSSSIQIDYDNILIRNFLLLFLCLFCFFNIVYMFPTTTKKIYIKKTSNDDHSTTSSSPEHKPLHFGIRIRSSQSMNQLKRLDI